MYLFQETVRFNGVSHKLKARWKMMLPKVNIVNENLDSLFYNMYYFIADLISCVEFNHDGELLATGDKGGRVVIFQRDPMVNKLNTFFKLLIFNYSIVCCIIHLYQFY